MPQAPATRNAAKLPATFASPMDHQLIVRFPAAAVSDHAAMVRLETALSGIFDETEELDGHDFGLDAADLFILTADPVRTFERIKPTLAHAGLLDTLTAAHGPTDAEEYAVLWPASDLARVIARA